MHSETTISSFNEFLTALDDDRVPKPEQKDFLEKASEAFQVLRADIDWTATERGEVDFPRLLWRIHKVFKKNRSAHKRELDQLETWLQALEDLGYLRAGRYLAMLARDQKDYDGAISRLSRLGTADAGDIEMPGVWFEAGYTVLLQHGLNADAIRTNEAGQGVLPEQAVVFFEKAAALEDAQSHYYLSQHWYAKAQDEDDATEAQGHRERAAEHTVRAADPKAGNSSAQAWLDYAGILRKQNDWSGAWEQALRSIHATPDKIKRNTRFKARWFAAWVAHDAPPGELIGWSGVVEEVAKFQTVIGERPDKAADFAKLLAAIQSKRQEAAPQFPETAAQAIRDLPQNYETISIGALFSRTKADRPPAQRAAFAQVLELLRGGTQDIERALNLLDRLADWSKELQGLGVFYARDVANDAALMWSRGEVYFQLARYEDAITTFAKAAELKPGDPKHLGMCYERVGAVQLAQYQFNGAAAAFLRGFEESDHPGLLLQFAHAKFLARPVNNAASMMHLLKYFIESQPAVIADSKNGKNTVASWQYTGHDPALQTLPQITIPLDGQPDKSALRYAILIGIWAKVSLNTNLDIAYRNASTFASCTLKERILAHKFPALIPHALVSMAAQMDDTGFLTELMCDGAEMADTTGRKRQVCAATHRRSLAGC
jgi:tetratricopeptide (TPR) repeat protein